jgi:hypothetical protein
MASTDVYTRPLPVGLVREIKLLYLGIKSQALFRHAQHWMLAKDARTDAKHAKRSIKNVTYKLMFKILACLASVLADLASI